MLRVFVYYGDFICTANMHILSHLAKYVRIWGPLWTHSSFGFENKNGHFKYFFMAKLILLTSYCLMLMYDAHFNVYKKSFVTLSHQRFCIISTVEFCLLQDQTCCRWCWQQTLSFPRPPPQGFRTYAVGKRIVKTLSLQESTAISHSGPIEVFYRLYKENSLYYSTSYGRATDSKRDSTSTVITGVKTKSILDALNSLH